MYKALGSKQAVLVMVFLLSLGAIASANETRKNESRSVSTSLTIGTVDGLAGQEVLVPITLGNATGVSLTSVQVICVFDPSVVTVLDLPGGPALDADWFTGVEIGANYFVFSAFNFYGSTALSGDIGYIRAAISSSTSVGTFTAFLVFDAFAIDNSSSFLPLEATSGGINVTGVYEPAPAPTSSDPLENFIADNLSQDSSSGTTTLLTSSGTSDTTLVTKLNDFIEQYEETLTFTDSTYTTETNYQAGSTTYVLIIRLASDSPTSTSGTSVIADAAGSTNVIIIVSAGSGGNGTDGGDAAASQGATGGSASALAGSGSIVIALAGNGGNGGATSGSDNGARGGRGGHSSAGLSAGSTGGQAFAASGNGGNGSDGSGKKNSGGKAGRGGNATATGGDQADLRSVGGNGGNGGNGSNGARGGKGGKGGNATVFTNGNSTVTNPTGGAGGSGGTGTPAGKAGKSGNGSVKLLECGDSDDDCED